LCGGALLVIHGVVDEGAAITEADWLACPDPLPMVEFLRTRTSSRKLRLIACACCRHIWDRITDERSRRAVEVTEWFADGMATSEQLLAANTGAYHASIVAAGRGGSAWASASAAFSASDADIANRIQGDGGVLGMAAYRARAGRRRRQCEVLRDVVGLLPFRSVCVAPADLAWSGGLIPKLAQAIYEAQELDRLPILADALEDAGCGHADIIDHLRSSDSHVRGCWALDLCLGKS
jgi:hypothetical protein